MLKSVVKYFECSFLFKMCGAQILKKYKMDYLPSKALKASFNEKT
jgi:hypothetical protein